jgi:hypothetical protein
MMIGYPIRQFIYAILLAGIFHYWNSCVLELC